MQSNFVARSYLFVPATRQDRIVKALSSPADEVIIDLEDSVGDADKASARDALEGLSTSRSALVRINLRGTDHFEGDVNFCNKVEWVKGVVIPKAQSIEDVEDTQRLLTRGKSILALIETPQGVMAVREIAKSGVSRLLFGSADYSASLSTTPSDELFVYPRSRLVVASSAAGLPAPVDGPTLDFSEPSLLMSQLRVARALGMGGKLCIHPSQVPFVSQIFLRSEFEKEWARAVLAAALENESGVFVYEGAMVDAPVLSRARDILQQ